jgi:hypothetical protein
MKKNGIAFLVVILLAVITILLIRHNGNSTVPKDLRDFAVADTASITKIFLADRAGHQVTLQKEKPGEWKVNGKWKARNDGIFNLLFVIKNLSIKSMIGEKAQASVIKNMVTGAIKIEIYKGNQLIRMYYVGSETPDDLGTYMLLSDPETKQNSTRPFIMCIEGQNRYLTPVYNTNSNEWRDRTAISCYPPDIKSVKLEYVEAKGKSYEVFQTAFNRFKIQTLPGNADYPDFDTMAVRQYLTYFAGASFETFLNEMKQQRRDSILWSSPLYILTLKDKNDKTTEIRLFGMEPHTEVVDAKGKPEKFDLDRMYALINKQELVAVQFYVFGKLIPDLEYFAKHKEPVKK